MASCRGSRSRAVVSLRKLAATSEPADAGAGELEPSRRCESLEELRTGPARATPSTKASRSCSNCVCASKAWLRASPQRKITDEGLTICARSPGREGRPRRKCPGGSAEGQPALPLRALSAHHVDDLLPIIEGCGCAAARPCISRLGRRGCGTAPPISTSSRRWSDATRRRPKRPWHATL